MSGASTYRILAASPPPPRWPRAARGAVLAVGLLLMLVVAPVISSIPVKGADGVARVVGGGGLVIEFSSPPLDRLPHLFPGTSATQELLMPEAKGGRACLSNCTSGLVVNWTSSVPTELNLYWCGVQSPCIRGHLAWTATGSGTAGEVTFTGNIGDNYLVTTSKNASVGWGMPNWALGSVIFILGSLVFLAGVAALALARSTPKEDPSSWARLPRPYAPILKPPPAARSPAPVGPPASP
ncbi:MAG: hypothetical protein KGJ23_06655 [Euryarchaeota archaeon]|nr:hypothetical protein [Euryarchaeota archaeon]MDE1836279.1 hypothetical protein [Euryarchaeota archaeon]MDE1880907.1 hypothetical protein [Euryarchaeota archaeon]MDE2044325.1 hypothetical protein [Thermoplasmata archaeon]